MKNTLTNFIRSEIESVVNQLDIHKIRYVMECCEWEWGGGPFNEDHIPTQAEIYDLAIDLITRAYEDNPNSFGIPNWIASGGLRGSCELSEDGHYIFRIVFELVEASNE